jgi:hypothetical protein
MLFSALRYALGKRTLFRLTRGRPIRETVPFTIDERTPYDGNEVEQKEP